MTLHFDDKLPEASLSGAPEVAAGTVVRRGRIATGIYLCVLVIALALTITMLSHDGIFSRIQIGSAGLVLFLCFLFLGLPIGVAMGLAGSIGIYSLGNFAILRRSLTDLPYDNAASWSLSVIPMFILMGLLLWRSGATDRVFAAARAWLNWLPGGHAITINMSGAALAAASGSTLGIAYALGRVGIPEMLRSGYDRRLALGAILMAGLPGQLIPPSLLLVVYAGATNLPVGPQLLAGVLPGIALVTVVATTIATLAVLFPHLAPRHQEEITWADRWQTLWRVWPVPVLILIVIVGMYSGLFTATEAAAVGVIVAILITLGFCRGRDRWDAIRTGILGTIHSVGSLFFIIIGSAIINRFMALSGIPTALANYVQSAGLGQTEFLLAAVFVMFLLGLFMESISMLLISIPVFLPAFDYFHVDLMWFGVIAVLVAETAVLTPPVGILVYLVHGLTLSEEVNVGQKISLGDVFKAAIMALPLVAVVVALLFIFPEIATWLPGASASR